MHMSMSNKLRKKSFDIVSTWPTWANKNFLYRLMAHPKKKKKN